jgi:TonB family protein
VDYSKQNTAINAPSAPPAPPAPKNVHTVCPNVATVQSSTPYPRAAMKAGIQEGTATARFTVHADGSISDITVSASNHYFAETATQMVQQLKCTGTGSDLTVTFPIGFKLED